MKSSNNWAARIRAALRTVTILALAVVIAGASATAVLADDRGDHDRDRDHRREAYHGPRRHVERGRYYAPAPAYYAPPPPPPVVYAPPPAPPGISFVFPIRIR